jgi:hypothetical protein
MRTQDAVYVAECKTPGCNSDLRLDSLVYPAYFPGSPYNIPVSHWSEKELICPDCKQTHKYKWTEGFEKAVEA